MRIERSNQNPIDLQSEASSPRATGSAATNTPDVLPAVNELMCSGDPGAVLAALTMTTARDEARASRQQRDAAMAAQDKAQAAEIQDLRDQANLQRAQGVFDGVMQIGEGACDFAGGMNGLASAGAKADAANEEHLIQGGYAQSDEQKAAMEGYAESRQQDALGYDKAATEDKAGATAFGASRSVGDGVFGGALTDKQADAKADEASADTFKQIAADARDDEKDAKDLLNKALDFYKEYVDTKNQTAMAAIHRA